ncbi:MAG: protein-ADP-ribose hydrolase [Oscillibacter sp.]|nr:protein-ADP-ribose hydrolase [Oscillibacter sp.]
MRPEERMPWLIRFLEEETPEYRGYGVPDDPGEQWRLLRSLFNVRAPGPVPAEFLSVQDALLRDMTAAKGVTNCRTLQPVRRNPRLFLWRGDITTLACDAIVNAANGQLLGCFVPCHGCIDNIIHTMSGVQLRLACHDIMTRQGHPEPTGQAKITPGYNLPARYVLHTVGPIVDGVLLRQHKELLANCYKSCLTLAAEYGLRSVAFCCVSTGVFRFPRRQAAEIALRSVEQFLAHDSTIEQVIFNVFSADDWNVYHELLQ